MATTPKFTLVQHSGAGYAGKEGFSRAVEVRTVSTAAEQKAVLKAGGVLFAHHVEADNVADKVNYPPEIQGMYPGCRGSFASLQVDMLPVYVPAPSELSITMWGLGVQVHADA